MITHRSTTYAPGSGTAIIGGDTLVLLDAAPDHAAVTALLDVVTQPLTLAAIAGRLSALGLESLPPLACAVFEGEELRLLLRGAVEVTTGASQDDQEPRVLHGRDVTTWREERLRAPTSLTIRLPGAHDEPVLPLAGGTAPATAVTSVVRQEAPPVAAGPLPVDRIEPVSATPRPAPEPGGDFDFGHLLGETRHRSVEDAAVRDDLTPPDDEEPPPAAAPEYSAEDPTEGPASDDPPPSVMASTPAAEETRTFHEDTPPVAPAPTPVAVLTSPAEPVPSPPPPGGLIDAVPGMTPVEAGGGSPPTEPPQGAPPPGDRALVAGPPPATSTEPAADLPPPPSAPAPAPADDGELDSATVRRPPTPATAAPDRGTTGPQVQAVHCPSGHPNAPHADRCRRCDAGIEDRTVTTIERPQLGRLVFPSGGAIPLTKPVVMGRRPPANSTVEGEAAMAVAVKEPEKMLSRVHLEVRLADWQVQVVDRDSMNHTFIEVPGQPPMQLRPAEAYPIQPGTTVNMADAVRFTYVTADP